MGVCPGWTDTQEAWQFALRSLFHARASGGREQRLEDDGPLRAERMKTWDDEVATHTIDLSEKAGKRQTESVTRPDPADQRDARVTVSGQTIRPMTASSFFGNSSPSAVLTLRGPLVMDCEWFLTGGPECSIPEPWSLASWPCC